MATSDLQARAMSVREVVDELALVGDVVLAQKEAGLEEDEVIESLFQSWRGRFETMVIDPQDVAAITRAVSAGPWKNDQRKALASTIMQQQRVVAQKKSRTPNQTCLHFHNMMTESDWAKARQMQSKAGVMNLLSMRAWMINLENPSEPTLVKMVAIVAFILGADSLSQSEVLQWKAELKAYIEARRKQTRKVQLTNIVDYRIEASELPPDILAFAYEGEAVPPCVEIPELVTTLGGAKMRGGKEPA